MFVKLLVALGYKRTHYTDGEFVKVLVEFCYNLNEEISRITEKLITRYVMESARYKN